jgi:hypothetical protein
MIGFLSTRVSFAEKQQRVCSYFQILAQVLVGYSFLGWQAIARICCTIQLIKHNIRQLSIFRDLMASGVSSLK